VDVHANKRDAAHQARSPCMRLGAGQSGATLVRCMTCSRPPVSAREHRDYIARSPPPDGDERPMPGWERPFMDNGRTRRY
jgi:hypothetical protein